MGDAGEEDLDLGTAVEALMESGDDQAAALLLDVEAVEYRSLDLAFSLESEMQTFTVVEARLTVPAFLVQRFDGGVKKRIYDALERAALQRDMHIQDLVIESRRAEPGWKERAEKRRGAGPSNQGVIGGPKDWAVVDRLRFRSGPEVAVYNALRRAQDKLSPNRTITIVPNPGVRVVGHTWEPDFIVVFRGRVGIIEVDSPYHSGRAAADKTRDHIYENGGIAYVDRWLVEDTTDPAKLDGSVDRFLRRLADP